MAISHQPLTPALGALVQGVDLAKITPAQFAQVYEIWKKHHVIVLREQRLTNAQFERFSALLGELDLGYTNMRYSRSERTGSHFVDLSLASRTAGIV